MKKEPLFGYEDRSGLNVYFKFTLTMMSMYLDFRLRLSTWDLQDLSLKLPRWVWMPLSCIAGSGVEQLRSWAFVCQPTGLGLQLWADLQPSTLLIYSKPHKVGNRIKAKQCWDSLYSTLKDLGCWVSNFWASTVTLNPKPLNPKPFKWWGLRVPNSQRLQYPLIKEYTLHHIRDPTII